MSRMLDYVAEAIRLLRDQADAVHESHNAPGETTFEGEPEAGAAYAELERVANGLETEIAARLRGESEQPAAVAGDAVRMREAIQRFVDREEAGEVHSKHVYTEFKEILSAAPAAPGHHFRVLLAEARREYRDTDAAGDVLAWLDERALDTDYAAPAPVAGDAVEAIAIALWHRFAPDDRIEWEDETEKAIYRDAAQQVAALAQDRAAQGGAAVPDGMLGRLEEAARRIENGHAPRRIPADPSDLDLVLAEVIAWLKGEAAPFWVPAAPTPDAALRTGGGEA